MKIINKAQADALFQTEAVLIGHENRVPEYRAEALFGADAVEHAQSLGHMNGYGTGDYTLMYLTYRGFLAAASFCNVQQLKCLAQEDTQA